MADTPFDLQVLNTLAALFLLLAFAMLSQRRVVALVNLLAVQGALLCDALTRVANRAEPSVPVRAVDVGAQGRVPAVAVAPAHQ